MTTMTAMKAEAGTADMVTTGSMATVAILRISEPQLLPRMPCSRPLRMLRWPQVCWALVGCCSRLLTMAACPGCCRPQGRCRGSRSTTIGWPKW